ncbi:uncharacterized protein METZ01_LOCUS117817 [marine metagenome]|uniref:Uncharacterized protein n=1 Tax=marine metagenome TaxID=408172 RepID=A0A381XKZ5_9ZZZZ
MLTDKQKTYIKRNFDVQPLEEMAEHLQVDSAIVASFIITELSSGLLKTELDFLKDIEPFQTTQAVSYKISFELDDKGDVQINMEWPRDSNSEEFVKNIGILLHMIHGGKMKPMLGENLIEIAQENNMEKEVLDVIHEWNELDKVDSSKPCVNPREVF